MKNGIGNALRTIRKEKNIKQKELVTENLSISQLINIEKSIHIPSTDKFIYLLDRYNTTYDEFLNHLDNTFLVEKKLLKEKLIEATRASNISILEKIAHKANTLYEKYNDIYFRHIELQTLASIELIRNNHDFTTAKKYVNPIKEYFAKVDTWGMYELSLLNNCLYMFELDDVITFGNKLLSSINQDSHLYNNKEIICILLNNFAIYTLDNSKYYLFSLRCSTFNEEIAFTTQNMTIITRAKILKQLAYYKLDNSKFDKNELLSLIQVFSTVGLNNPYHTFIQLCKKHGITLD